MKRFFRCFLLLLGCAVVVALFWFLFTPKAKIDGLRKVLYYQAVKRLGGPTLHDDNPTGSLAGAVHDDRGAPVDGALALIASPLGDTYWAETGANGSFQISNVPPGRYVPVAAHRGYRDALPKGCLAGVCRKNSVSVRSGRETGPVNLELIAVPPPPIAIDDSLVVSATVEIETTAPLPGRARRAHFSFKRGGLLLNDCYLYEPVEGEGPFPTLLLVLPGPVLGWEIIPVPFAAKGYSVLAFYPLRGTNIDEDAVDILTALEYLRQGRLPSRADTEKLGLIDASFTSLHGYRLLGQTDRVDVALVLGGIADAFAFRHDVEAGTAHTRPPFDQVLMALGFPNRSPELYFRYSAIYHLEGMPPLCLLHGRDDELVPYNQSVLLDAELTRRGMPHEFYSYDGLKHYFSTSADDATTQQMFRDSLDCLGRGLEGD